MFNRRKKIKKTKPVGKKTETPLPEGGKPSFSDDLDENIKMIGKLFENDDCLIVREFTVPDADGLRCAAVFIESMANDLLVSEFLMKGIGSVHGKKVTRTDDPLGSLFDLRLRGSDIRIESDPEKIVTAILSGSAALFCDGSSAAALADTKGYESRSIEEPENEKLLRGPREGFTEKLTTDISLIRRRILTTDLKVKFLSLGRRTNTKIALCYLENLVKPEILSALCERLKKIDMDGILDSNYLEEHISDRPVSPFKTVGSTERPDTAAARILEGRIAVIVNGSPAVLTVPFVFVENFQSGDDYYSGFFFANVGRMLRYAAFFLTVSVPAVYVALLTFHRQMMPTNFALSIAGSRAGVPFPVFVECAGLLLVFEILRETSVRMPTAVGQSLSVVGAIVIGESAVNAKIVSAPTVIVVGITALAGLMIPRLKAAMIIYRAFLLLCAAFIGLYGYIFGCCLIVLRLLETKSFGVDYLSYLISLEPQQMKDTVVRVPWTRMIQRPKGIAADLFRQKTNEK